ncbi:hypothetical protein PIB30_085645 [Stylosanthes scabra]|uniref:Uncharacterized protein n=1 Tax=Stylosanthes scabra TaxID=79078 RepID=A0ABU6WR91_9FABA|nr:hypothetical protein [Stylosanthes scabra]
MKGENASLKGKVHGLEKDKSDLESSVVELCGQKKKAEVTKENRGYDMLLVGFDRAKRKAELFFPEMKFDKLDPIKVVHNGALVDDDEVDLEGGDDHNPEATKPTLSNGRMGGINPVPKFLGYLTNAKDQGLWNANNPSRSTR